MTENPLTTAVNDSEKGREFARRRKPLSKAQATTLQTIARNGGEMNGYAGQPGFWCNSVGPMIRQGYLVPVPCPQCADFNNEACCAAQARGSRCYNRVRLTDDGRQVADPR